MFLGPQVAINLLDVLILGLGVEDLWYLGFQVLEF